MKWIKYQILCNDVESILVAKKVGYSEDNLAIAEKEAYDGYEIVEDEIDYEKEPLDIKHGGTSATSLLEAADKLGFSSFREAKRITAGTDLNTMTTIGNYKCSLKTDADTFLNCPVKNKGFRMNVYNCVPGLPEYIAQEIFEVSSGTRHYRCSITSGETWNDWTTTYDSETVVPIEDGGTGATSLLTAADTLGFPSLYKATAILANTNLNDLTTVGNYKCTNINTAGTYTNCPVKKSFRLYVYEPAPGVSGYIAQDLHVLASGTRYYRYTANGGTSWGGWIMTHDSSSPVQITNGGTGATSLLEAANSLGFPSLSKATQIEDGADLNTILTIGNYMCTPPAKVAALQNCPTSNAFRMFVYSSIPGVSGYISQLIFDVTGNLILRRTYDGGKTWKEDKKYFDDSIIKDYVTATGTSGEWTYRKWSSGLIEAWGRLMQAKVVEIEPEGDYPRIEVQAAFPSVFGRVDVINATPSDAKTPFGISRAVATEEYGKLNFTIYIVPDYVDNFAVGDTFYINCEIKGIL